MKIFTIEPKIYTYDIDSSHHVNNITYIRWMEMARVELLEDIGMAVHEIEKFDFAPVLTHTEISYKKPLYLGDKIRVELFFSELKKISGTMKFHFIRGEDELVAEGRQDALFFSLSTKRPHKLTAEQRIKIAQYLVT